MPEYNSVEELVAAERARKPWLSDEIWTDERIYRLYKSKHPTSKSLWEEQDKQLERGVSGDVSANAMNGLASTFDYFIDNNSSEWMKLAYNKSLTGLTERLFSGDERYNLDDYNPGIISDIASTALSFMMPLDLLTFWAGGQLAKPIAGFAAKGLGYSAQKVATAAGRDMIIPAYRVMAQKTLQKTGERMLLQGINQGTALAVFEGAIGGVQAAIDGEDILPGITHGVIHGGIMGGFAGAVGGGLMAKHAQFFGVSARGQQIAKGTLEGKVPSRLDYIKKVGLGIPGQLAAESAVFTVPAIEELSRTDELTAKNLMVEYFKNVGLFGILKTKHHLFERGVKFLDDHHTLFGEPAKNHGVDNAVKGVQENLEESGRAKDTILNKDVNQENIDRFDRVRTEFFEKTEISEADYIELKEDINWLRRGIKNNSLDKNNTKDVERASKTITKLNGVLSDLSAEYKELEGLRGISEVVKEEFEGWKNEMDMLHEKLNNLEEGKTKKIEDEGITVGYIRNYLIEEKGIDKIKRYVDPKTKEVLEEPIDIPTFKATEQELIDRYASLEKRRTEGIEEVEAKTGVRIGKEISKEPFEILTTKGFEEKDWSPIIKDPKQRKDVEARVEILSKSDAKVVADTGGFESGSAKSSKYESSKNIVRHFIQNVFPEQIGKTVKKGAFVGNPALKASHLNSFAKWMAERGKEFKDVTNEDYKLYLSQHPSHITELQQLREFLQTNQISSRKFNLTRDMTKVYATKYIGESPEGLTFDAHSIGKNSITYVQPKTNQPITKYISTKLKNLLTSLKKVVGIKDPDVNQYFLTKDGKLINNKVLNSFVDNIFGAKNLKDRARLFRDSLTSWAGEKFGSTSSEVELLKQQVLGDKAKLDVISKAYVKGDYRTQASKLVKQFLAEINEGKKRTKGKGFYSTYEIAQGLKKLEGKKDITFKANIGTKNNPLYKKVTIDVLTAEAMARYLIETSPRLNEIVSSKEAEKVKYQLEPQTKLRKVGLEEQKKQREFFIGVAKDKIPDFSIKLNRKLGKKNGERILGVASEYTARIAKGEVREDTVPHEVSHVFTEIIENFGTPEAKRILQEGLRAVRQHHRKELSKLSPEKRKAQEKELLNQTVGEMATEAMKTEKRWEKLTGEKAPLYKKLARVIKKFWSQMKLALGMQSKKDVARLMAEGFVTGKLVPTVEKGAEMSKVEYYQTERTANSLRNEIKAIERENFKVGNITHLEIKDARKFDSFTIPTGGKGKWKKGLEDGSLTPEMLDQYLYRLKELTAGRKPIAVKISEIDRDFNVSPEERKLVLEKVFGVRDGDIKNITSKTLHKVYGDVIARYKNKFVRNDSSTDLGIFFKESNKLPQSFFRRAVTDTFHLIRDYFDEGLAHNITAHERAALSFIGKGSTEVRRIQKLIKKDIKRLDLYDPEVVARKRAAGVLDKKDERFISQLKVKGSNERKAIGIHKKLMNYYWKSLFSEYKQHMPNITFAQFERSYGQRFINNYFTRKVTREALEYMTKDSEYMQKVVDNSMKDAATSKAKNDLKGKKDVTDTEIANLRDVYLEDSNLRTEVINLIYDMIHYAPSKIQNNNLLTRGIMFPEYIPVIKGGKTKMVRVYEPNYGATIESYIMNMSKFIATARYFPEFTKIGSQYNIPGSTKATFIEAQSKGQKLGEMSEYAYQALMSQLGNDIYRDQLNSKQRRYFAGTASLFAATGLSSPLSGIKNLLIGIPRAVATFGLKNTISGVRTLWDAATWESARKAGLTEYGAHSLELKGKKLPGVPFSMELLFKLNFMTRTENFNRIISSHAGTLFFDQVMKRYKGEPTLFKGVRGKKNEYRILREVYKLSKEEISWLENTNVTLPENAIKYKVILDKVMHESHISTQGGTSTARLPLWMQSPYKKEWTLFQRIATSVTIDTYHNYVKPAVKGQNYAPLFKALVGHALSGAALYTMYDSLLGQEPPKSQSNDLEKVAMYLWRGEFFGVLGESLSPYDRELAMPIMEPVIFRNLKEGGKNLMAVYQGHKTWDQGITDFIRRSVVVVGQGMRLAEKNKSPFYEKHRRVRTLTNEFMKVKGYNTPTSFSLTERQPYYRNLKDNLMFGSDEKIVQEYWKAMNFLISDQAQHGITNARYATKEAHGLIMRSVKGRMNPLNISDEKIISGKQVRINSKRVEFLNWLTPEKRKEAKELEIHYQYRLRKFEKLIDKKYYRELYFVFPYSSFIK